MSPAGLLPLLCRGCPPGLRRKGKKRRCLSPLEAGVKLVYQSCCTVWGCFGGVGVHTLKGSTATFAPLDWTWAKAVYKSCVNLHAWGYNYTTSPAPCSVARRGRALFYCRSSGICAKMLVTPLGVNGEDKRHHSQTGNNLNY